VTCGTGKNCDKGVSWAYYTPTPETIWTAPAAIPEVCYGENDLNYLGQSCGTANGGTEWKDHVFLQTQSDGAPIFDALLNCTLPQITWVIPDKVWSDHAGLTGLYGPSYVGDIVDAVGGGMAKSSCNFTGSGKYWTQEPTAIFILWDDWGGWFDHVPPPAVYTGTDTPLTCPNPPVPNGWGCGNVYGFRVPLLVVSEYTQAGYVSGALPSPGKVAKYEHDFGSILAFTENNFTMPFIDLPDKGYADYNALDRANNNVPLSDFFNVNNQRTFTNIQTLKDYTYFQGHSQYDPNWVPTGPDDDSEVD
jgi:phosphoesterase family protein